MKVHELLVEDAINVQQDSKKLLKSLGDVCREHGCTMEMDQTMGAGVSKTGSSWSGTFRLRKKGEASRMDYDEQELTLKLLRRDIIKWLKERMAEGRAIGSSKTTMTTNPDSMLSPIAKGWSDLPQFTGKFFIGIPPGAEPEHVVRISSYGLKDLDTRRQERWGDRPNQVHMKYDEVPFDIATSFTDEAEVKKVVKQLNATLKKDKVLLFRLLLDAVKQAGHGDKNLGFDTYGTGGFPVNTPAELDAYIKHKQTQDHGFHITIKKGIKAKDTIMVEKDKLLELMKKYGIS